MGLPNVTFTWRSIKVLRAIISTMSMIGLIIVLAAVIWAIKLRRDIGDYLNLAVPGDGHLWPTVIVVAAVPCAPVYILGLKAYLCLPIALQRTKFDGNDGRESDDEHNSKVPDILDSDYDEEDEEDDNNDNDDNDDNDDDDDDNDEKNNGHEANRILFLHAVLCLISGCLVAAINVACFLRSSTFQQKIRDDRSSSMIEAMENYANDDVVRSCIDAVQMDLECCGSEDYRDWFRVGWSKESMEYFDYEDYKRRQEEMEEEGQSTINEEARVTTVKDVPFSCCTNKIVEPCGHREILQASQVCNFDPNKEGTVWNVGCRSIILTHARVVGYFLIFYLLFLSIYQFALSVLSRLVQTAHSNDFYIGPGRIYYRAWIFGRVESSRLTRTKFHGNISHGSDEETLDTRSLTKGTSLESPDFRSEHKVNNNNDNNNDNNDHRRRRHHRRHHHHHHHHHSNERKRQQQQEREFFLTPRGSVQLVQIDRPRKVKSSPVLSNNGATDGNQRNKNKIRMFRYLPNSIEERDRDRSLDDDQIFIEKNERSVKANLKSREKSTTRTTNVIIAPTPPPFPPQAEEYEEKRNIHEKSNKNEEFQGAKSRSAFLRFSTTDNTRNKVNKESSTSKPSKLDRKKLLEKFERILNAEERNRRESGGADVPRPWEQLVKRGIDSTERNDHEDRLIQSPRLSERSNVLTRFNPTDAYDRFRGTLQDTLSRRDNPNSQFNNFNRSTRQGTCACCAKRNNRNFGRPSRCKVQRTSYGRTIDPDDYNKIVQRRNLLPDIPCPPTPPPPPVSLPPPLPPASPPNRSHASPSSYPRPTLIRQQQREQRRQRQCQPWNFRRNYNRNNHQPPPWTIPTSFARTTNYSANSNNNNCLHCQGRGLPTANKGYSTFVKNDTIGKYRRFMD